MVDIKDFQCTYQNSAGISAEVTRRLGLSFPDAYLNHHTMAILSKALKEYDGAAFCELPFCHTVEAEAMGGRIDYGNEAVGPRAKEYICTSVEEIFTLPEIDFTSGRIHEVLLACRELKDAGEQVVLQISGPFTILNVLIDARYVFKAMRKKPELMKEVFWKLGNQILRFMKEACQYGVDMLSYADSSGGVNILGPKMAEQVVEDFTYDFLQKADKIVGENTLVLLCPKTTFALIGTGKARFQDVKLPEPENYGKACIQMIGKIRFAGQMCIKNRDYRLENGIFKAVELKEGYEGGECDEL
ncbi:MAG: uroporphyrinogen decarboxylase family protein [Lachnospiraceae bacterium]